MMQTQLKEFSEYLLPRIRKFVPLKLFLAKLYDLIFLLNHNYLATKDR